MGEAGDLSDTGCCDLEPLQHIRNSLEHLHCFVKDMGSMQEWKYGFQFTHSGPIFHDKKWSAKVDHDY